MLEKMLCKARKRERRFRRFLKVAMVFQGTALGLFFLALMLGNAAEVGYTGLAFFGIGALFSGLAGLNANNFWGVSESVVSSAEVREEILKMCEEME